jgi:hypothetical protein
MLLAVQNSSAEDINNINWNFIFIEFPFKNLNAFNFMEKKWEYSVTVRKLLVFVDFKVAHDLVRIEVIHNIIFEFCFPMKIQ